MMRLMSNARLSVALLICLFMIGVTTPSGSAGGEAELVARGKYLVTIMDCGGCHTRGALVGKPDPAWLLAGSDIGFAIPEVGVVYPRNLTPDADTGLGKWTDAEIMRAIRLGQSRNRRPLAPIMPWPSYSALTDADAEAMVAYLRSLTPIRFDVPRNARPGEKPTAPYLTLVEPK